ncbi:MAG: GIY-YIG nuclease family protein [bacterium]|nr:GIY-YIG nuclease family protein [bacterium]
MYQVYILKSLKDLRTYTWYASDAMIRLKVHNAGRVKATKNRRPFEIIYIENLQTLKEVKRRELYWKSGAGRRKLKDYFSKGFPKLET